MNKQDRQIRRRLRKMIAEMEIGPGINRREGRSNQTLSDLYFNSVYLMEISMRIYDEFSVDINAVDLGNMTLSDIAMRINEPKRLLTV